MMPNTEIDTAKNVQKKSREKDHVIEYLIAKKCENIQVDKFDMLSVCKELGWR